MAIIDQIKSLLAPGQADGNGGPQIPFLTLVALGVVYGDIGTSPLYAFRYCFFDKGRVLPSRDNVLGILLDRLVLDSGELGAVPVETLNSRQPMKNMSRTIAMLLMVSALSAAPALSAPAEGPKPAEKLQKEFLTWRFGIFLHFNMATFNNCEWANGYEDAATFTPNKLDCGQWADAAKAAGMKYAVLTVKHTGGWCLWPSKYTRHDIAEFRNYQNGRGDIVRAFVDAFRARGLKVGLYYCFPGDYTRDRGLPAGKPDLHGLPPEAAGDYVGFIKKQMAEILRNYGPIDLLWIDQYNNRYTRAHWTEIKAFIKSRQPNCVIIANNCHNFRDTDICEFEYPYLNQVHPKSALPPADNMKPSEVCDKICGGWFWKKTDRAQEMRSAADVSAMVKLCNSRRANYLLDVPPDTTGLLPEMFVKRLKEIGELLGGKSTPHP